MITVASHEGRTILGRLDKGVDILDGLAEVCRSRQVRTGTVVALGALQSAEVAHYDTVAMQYGPARELTGPLEILSAVGNISESEGELALHLHITLSRERDNGIEVVGGHLVSGEVFACEFTITALDDVMLRRGPDQSTGLNLWKEGFERDDAPDAGTPVAELGRVSSGSSGTEKAKAKPAAKIEAAPKPKAKAKPKTKAKAKAKPAAAPKATPKPAGSEMSWAEVAAASKIAQATSPLEPAVLPPKPKPPEIDDDDEGEEVDDELDFLEVEPGDIVEHPKFKRCKVARVEGDMEYVQVRLRNGNLVRLSLDIVRLVLVGSEDGHQVFKAIIDV